MRVCKARIKIKACKKMRARKAHKIMEAPKSRIKTKARKAC